MTTILYYPDDITLLYSLFPLVRTRRRRLFRFSADLDWVLQRDRNDSLLVVRFHKRPEYNDPEPLFRRLRDKYRRLVYFDDFADPREVNHRLFPFVDAYYKKQLLRDRGGYRADAYGKCFFTDYYHRRHGVVDETPVILPPLKAEDIGKFRLSWNLGVGVYPRSRIRRAVAVRLNLLFGAASLSAILRPPARSVSAELRRRSNHQRRPVVSARLGMRFDRETVAYHRKLYLGTIAANPDLFLSGRVRLRDFNHELREVAATFSPFGFGEVCFRDFEAIVHGSALVKPDMSHIETWPNLYRPGETYVPVDWDGVDLVETCRALVADQQRQACLAEAASETFFDAYRGLESRVDLLLADLS